MSVLNQLVNAFPDHKAPGKRWFNINCPFCEQTGRKPDRKHKLGINYKKGYIHCFRCKRVHKLSYFLKLMDIQIDLEGLETEDSEPITYFVPKQKNPIDFPSEYINILDLYDTRYPVYLQALEYIDRRIGIELAVKLNVGFCGIGDYANRIVIPVFENDEIIYFAARAIFPFIDPKIKNPPGARRDILFNWNVAQRFSEIFIMEGIFGAVTVYPYGVATLGKEITDEQILKIIRTNVKIINIVLDNNAIQDAYVVAKRIQEFTHRVKIRVVELKAGQPDDFTFEHLLLLKSNTHFYTRMF
jgi:hypothetical protein